MPNHSMNKKPFAWSFSAWEAYDLCPKKYAEEKIFKTVFVPQTEAMSYGKTVHSAFEHYLLKGQRLPLDLVHHAPRLDTLREMPGKPLAEQRLALTRDLNPTGFFDADVWLRGVIDYAKIRDSGVIVIVDHKTGKVKDDFEQLELMAAMMMVYEQDTKGFVLAYYWTKIKDFTRKPLRVEEATGVWNKWMARAQEMERAYDKEEYPAKQCFLCARHCPVKKCRFNGG